MGAFATSLGETSDGAKALFLVELLIYHLEGKEISSILEKTKLLR